MEVIMLAMEAKDSCGGNNTIFVSSTQTLFRIIETWLQGVAPCNMLLLLVGDFWHVYLLVKVAFQFDMYFFIIITK